MERADREAQRLLVVGVAIAAKPVTFMNLSGTAVGGLVRYFKVAQEDSSWSSSTRCSCRWPGFEPASGIGRRAQRTESIVEHLGEDFARAEGRVGAAACGGYSSDHGSPRFDWSEEAEVERMTARSRRRGGDVHHAQGSRW